MPRQAVFLSTAVEQTKALGKQLARQLKPGAVVSVDGPLGAGKTVFVDGMARGLGCELRATSPSFTLVHVYPGPTRLVHADLYRVESPDEVEELALDEIQAHNEGILVVEWAERFASLLPHDRVAVRIDFAQQGRQITVSGAAPDVMRIVEGLRNPVRSPE